MTTVETLERKAVSDRARRSNERQQTETARPRTIAHYYENRLPSVILQSLLRQIEVGKETELAEMAVVVEKTALKSRKRSRTERTRDCGFSVAQNIRKLFGFRKCA